MEHKTKTYLNWVHELYYTEIQDENNQTFEKFNWGRGVTTIIVIMINLARKVTFIESYYYGTLAELNSGVLMCVYSLKPLFSSLSFYMFFNQKLYSFEILGIFMCIISVFLI